MDPILVDRSSIEFTRPVTSHQSMKELRASKGGTMRLCSVSIRDEGVIAYRQLLRASRTRRWCGGAGEAILDPRRDFLRAFESSADVFDAG